MSLRTARQREEVVCLQEVERVEALWTNLRAAMEEKFPGDVGGKYDLVFSSLASYLSLHLKNKIARWVHSCSGVGSWEEPLVSEGLWSPEDLGGQQTEQELKEDLWDAVCKANESTRSKSSIRRFGAARVKGVYPFWILPRCPHGMSWFGRINPITLSLVSWNCFPWVAVTTGHTCSSDKTKRESRCRFGSG